MMTSVKRVVRPRVLLAEDDDELRWCLRDLLNLEGYDVVAACDGVELLREVGEHLESPQYLPCPAPHTLRAIITDVRMPGFHTWNILSGLRDLGMQPPVIVMTAFGDEEMREKARAVGAVAFLNKPFDPSLFLGALRTAIDSFDVSQRGFIRASG
jgi:CheY-like chemotaxis protein